MATLSNSMIMVDGYFRAKDGKETESDTKIPPLLEVGKQHPHLKSYTFARRADGLVHWSERAETAEAYLAHLETISGYIDEAYGIRDFERIEVAGPASEIEKLKTNKYLNGAVFYETEDGWNR
eukprot:CAMPEP_0184741212 /NCGR_PEP_ID=MMETSP0315-20130426/4272_1 /TAXON_ID=101924 /ORGANISM="Rhodosorus marinus, Strain UTEX LB 2760" /LENGTH=122 /DNA_ID=CAMNT_0027211393 /DNA_START=342 /DNA_END=710 /DNA_ORIENTATION=+